MDSRTRIIIGGVIGALLLVGLLAYLLVRNLQFGNTNQEVTLQMWGVFDESQYFESAIADYQKDHPNIHVIYRAFNFNEYESQLLNSFAAGTGPDIFFMHNTWLPKEKDKIAPMPTTIPGQKETQIQFKEYQTQFVDVATSDLTLNGQIYAMPLYIDTLALYYNKDLLNSAGITAPPRTYEELNADVQALTTLDSAGNILHSGIALGTAQNINRSTDVLGMLMLQSGVKMTNSDNTEAIFSRNVDGKNVSEVALQYYTDFANPAKQVYTWNSQQHYSIDAFVNGETAMMFNYSHQVPTIRAKSARFNFGIAPVPQISGSATAVTYANYWAPTVSKQSKSVVEAWRFLTYLSSARGATFYLNASKRPAARRDLVELEKNDLDLGVFALQSLTARSWYEVDNVAIENILANMINAVNVGQSTVREALKSAEDQINILMVKARSSF
jgi:multiple sugar transport system substrate-binding protein